LPPAIRTRITQREYLPGRLSPADTQAAFQSAPLSQDALVDYWAGQIDMTGLVSCVATAFGLTITLCMLIRSRQAGSRIPFVGGKPATRTVDKTDRSSR
jgi:hypothetical protein